MKDSQTLRHSFVLLMAASIISGCSHTGAVHYANDTTVNPDADVETEELMAETGMTTLHGGPGGYR